MWRQRSGSTLAQVMACCLTASSHYLKQYWLIISKVQYHSIAGCAAPATLQLRHNGRNCISNHQPHECFYSTVYSDWSKKTSKLRITGLCAWNSPVTGEFPAQMASNAENVSIWWRHHACPANEKCRMASDHTAQAAGWGWGSSKFSLSHMAMFNPCPAELFREISSALWNWYIDPR